MVSVQLLGELAVWDGDEAVALPPSRKTRALLAYLAATAKPQRRERLCELFWDLPDDPRGALRWSLSKLRAILDRPEAPVVMADRNCASVDLPPQQVDVLAIRDALRDGVEGAATQILEGLATKFRGPFMADLDLPQHPELQSWIAGMREEMRRLHAEILTALDQRHAAAPERALPFARELVQLDPYSEAAWARLLERLHALGRRREAEEQYAAAVKALSEVGGSTGALERANRPAPGEDAATVPPPLAAPPAAVRQEVRFCRAADGARIAYGLAGQGPPLVKSANWMNHLEYDWESPIFGHFLRELANGRRLLRYDARGNGLSDWDVGELNLEVWLSDLEAVVDAAGFERFPLLGLSQGCAIAIAYAVRHPERVSHLILHAGYLAGAHARGDMPEEAEKRSAMTTLMRVGWGKENPAFRQLFASLFIPGATPELAEAFNMLQRKTTSPECAARYHEASGLLDVRHLAVQIAVPTLVMHGRGDAMIPLAAGRELAAAIPGARFVILPGQNHILLPDEPATARFFEELRLFIGG